MKTILLVILLLFTPLSVFASDSTYNAVISGKKCQEDSSQNLSCSYRVGKTLWIEIAGIGLPTTGIAFLRSDVDGDYYGKYLLQSECISVNSAKDFWSLAFISPKTGKVYKTWQECKNGM